MAQGGKVSSGTYRCLACGSLWDASQVYLDPSRLSLPPTCGDLLCGADVVRISDEPYVAEASGKE